MSVWGPSWAGSWSGYWAESGVTTPPNRFYFAWIDSTEVFDPAVHNREDEQIFSFKLNATEGDFAALELVIENPKIGLLNPARKVNCFFSMNIGTDAVPIIKLLFKGRLVGVPSNMFAELVTLSFSARPADFVAQKLSVATSLKEAPYWEPLCVAPEKWSDPDVVLEARTQLWHIDPATHVVSVSDVLVPEDGVIEFLESQVLYDGVAVTLQTVPLTSVDVVATVPWTQSDTGSVDLTAKILQEYPGSTGLGGLISSFTFDGLSSAWPKDGARIGDGWAVSSGSLDDLSFLAVPEIKLPDYFDPNAQPQKIPEGSIVFMPAISGRIWGGEDGAGFDTTVQQVVVPIGYGSPQLTVNYAAKREFAQVIHFTLFTDMQEIVTLSDGSEAMQISISANKVSDLTEDGTLPIGDVRARDFIHSARGRLFMEHLILIARANLVIRSRAVQVAFQVGLLDGILATLRKGALVHDHRLPGGQAEGKIIAYQFELDGSNGTALATITLGCAVGRGGAYVEDPGEPTWVDAGWVGSDWQEYSNVVRLLPTSDITYALPVQGYFDDGTDFQRGLNAHNAVKSLVVTNGPNVQRAALLAAVPGIGDQAAASAALQSVPTHISLLLLPMSGGPFKGGVEVGVADLIVPKQIDLEAASV